jgi:hypothetical protein
MFQKKIIIKKKIKIIKMMIIEIIKVEAEEDRAVTEENIKNIIEPIKEATTID